MDGDLPVTLSIDDGFFEDCLAEMVLVRFVIENLRGMAKRVALFDLTAQGVILIGPDRLSLFLEDTVAVDVVTVASFNLNLIIFDHLTEEAV